MALVDITTGFGYNALLDYGLQATLRRQEEGLAALTPTELQFDLLHGVCSLGLGEWYDWMTGNPPSWLLASVAKTAEIGAKDMSGLLETVLHYHAAPEDYLKEWEWESVGEWEEHITHRTRTFESPEGEEPLPPRLRGKLTFSEYPPSKDGTKWDGSLAGCGFTPESWASFKQAAEKGDRPEVYEAWFHEHRGDAEAGYCLRLTSFTKKGWLFPQWSWVALPNPWNAFMAASEVFSRCEEDFAAKASAWTESHWREVRIFDADLRLTVPGN